jgi:hypothetical protein
MVLVAALIMGLPVAVAGILVTAGVCVIVGKPGAFFWSAVAGLVFALGFIAGLAMRLHFSFRRDEFAPSVHVPGRPGVRFPVLAMLDGAGLAWFGAWAWAFPAGRVRPGIKILLGVFILGCGVFLSIGAAFSRHQAVPAAMVAVIGGIAVFMLCLRCHPLGSPILRTAPIGFASAWFRLLRIPLLLSTLFFAVPATAAVAAEPGAWTIPVGGGLGLLVLNAAYGVFAAYFLTSPLAAVVSFVSALAYCNYESVEYGRTVFIGFAALTAWLWYRARLRYYNG